MPSSTAGKSFVRARANRAAMLAGLYTRVLGSTFGGTQAPVARPKSWLLPSKALHPQPQSNPFQQRGCLFQGRLYDMSEQWGRPISHQESLVIGFRKLCLLLTPIHASSEQLWWP